MDIVGFFSHNKVDVSGNFRFDASNRTHKKSIIQFINFVPLQNTMQIAKYMCNSHTAQNQDDLAYI